MPVDFLCPDFDEIVDGAGCRLDSEIILQCFGDSVVGPTFLPECADQFDVRFQFALGWLRIGCGKE